MAKTTAERVKEHRKRKRAKRMFEDVSSEIQKRLAEDMKFSFHWTDRGTLKVDWEWSARTEGFLEGYAAAKGWTNDYILQELSYAVRDEALRRAADQGE